MAKKKTKAGRKRKSGERYPSGDRKAHVVQEEVMSVALEARQRQFGVSKQAALRAETGTAIGRLVNWSHETRGQLSKAQHAALTEYRSAHWEAMWAYNIKRQRSASDFSGVPGFDNSDGSEPDYVEQCQRKIARYTQFRRTALEATPLADMALQGWVIEDRELWACLGDLRLAANALVRKLTPRT